MSNVKCTVMNASGNRFAIVDTRNYPELSLSPDKEKIIASCDKYDVDGLVYITNPSREDCSAKMLIWNRDGSSAEQCGNALRCVAKIEIDRLQKTKVQIESPTGNFSHQCTGEYKCMYDDLSDISTSNVEELIPLNEMASRIAFKVWMESLGYSAISTDGKYALEKAFRTYHTLVSLSKESDNA